MACPAAPRAVGAVVVCWLTCAALASAAGPPSPVPDAQATASDATVVHSGAGEQAPVVGQLAKGDVVTIDIELDGDAGHWCKVIAQGQTVSLGYVSCSSLERRPRRRWTRVTTATPSAGAPPPRAKPAAADSAKRPYSDVKVLFYSAPWCPHSARARAFLQSLGVSVTEYDIDKDSEKKAELVAKVGSVAVPLIDVEALARARSAARSRSAGPRTRR
jgi:glutaredoxin